MSEGYVSEGYVEEALEKSNESGKRWFSVTIDGKRGTTFDMTLGRGLKRGDYGLYEFTQDGKFSTLRRFEKKTPPTASSGAGGWDKIGVRISPDDRDARISRSHALTTSVAILLPGVKKETPDEVLAKAIALSEMVVQYTVAGVNPYKGSLDPLFEGLAPTTPGQIQGKAK